MRSDGETPPHFWISLIDAIILTFPPHCSISIANTLSEPTKYRASGGLTGSVVLKLGPVVLAEFGAQVIDEESDFCRQVAPAEINRVDAEI